MTYETIVSVQQQQPEWIIERHQQVNLSLCKVFFVKQLQESLEQMHDRGPIALTLKRFLQKLCIADFFESAIYQDLLQQIDAEFFSRADRPLGPESIAILLLDAENIRLSPIEEGLLFRFSTYPVRAKIAFANWRSLGKHDLDFHDRSYQMIHVPTGKNAADIQMTAIGASLFFHYPNAKEVFVCSSDAHLVTLCNLLQTQGWKVHAVRKWGAKFTLADWTNGKIQIFSLTRSEFDPHDELEQKLAKLLLALTARNPSGSISLGVLASQFKKQYGSGVTDVMRSWNLGSQFLKFLQSCRMFRLVQVEADWQVAIRPIVPSIEPLVEPSIFDRVSPV